MASSTQKPLGCSPIRHARLRALANPHEFLSAVAYEQHGPDRIVRYTGSGYGLADLEDMIRAVQSVVPGPMPTGYSIRSSGLHVTVECDAIGA